MLPYSFQALVRADARTQESAQVFIVAVEPSGYRDGVSLGDRQAPLWRGSRERLIYSNEPQAHGQH